MLARIRANAEATAHGRALKARLSEAAAPWLAMDDDALWGLMFGPALLRSWMVWPTGYCPACRTDVPMYNWLMDALATPWKTQCPHCGALFPTNDFAAFYRSGLNAHGVFDPARADRSLLYNSEHANPAIDCRDGVDDGEGFQQDGHTWWFTGAYLIYGQWKRLVLGGIHCLAAAHAVTGDPVYARKAAILLDRVADLYPEFDFAQQAIVHDSPANEGCPGYVSIWYDASGETRLLAMAYDVIFATIRDDAALLAFLRDKAAVYQLENPKASFADIQRNIETRIFRDAFQHRAKIKCNYPQSDFTIAVILTVLEWPRNREKVRALLDWILYHATRVDGTTGEKGMTDYPPSPPRRWAISWRSSPGWTPTTCRWRCRPIPTCGKLFASSAMSAALTGIIHRWAMPAVSPCSTGTWASTFSRAGLCRLAYLAAAQLHYWPTGHHRLALHLPLAICIAPPATRSMRRQRYAMHTRRWMSCPMILALKTPPLSAPNYWTLSPAKAWLRASAASTRRNGRWPFCAPATPSQPVLRGCTTSPADSGTATPTA